LIQEVRDPRFSQLSGEFDTTKFQNHYNFLSDMRQGELVTLRDSLKRARKLLTSSPQHLRPEREAEVERLELAVKRAESSVNRDKRERVEREALTAISKEERNKQQKGKKAFWLKNGRPFHYLQPRLLMTQTADKKKLLLKARYDATAAEGGKKAVKKVIEKKRKKQSQKETKSRPLPRVTESASTPMPRLSRKRKASGDYDARARKHTKSA
jgi:ribosomal RNA-processing protein 36